MQAACEKAAPDQAATCQRSKRGRSTHYRQYPFQRSRSPHLSAKL